MKRDEVQRLLARAGPGVRQANPGVFGQGPTQAAPAPTKRDDAKCKPRGRKPMNGTERAFSLRLDAMQRRFEIESWEREGLTLRWPDGMTYTPDFTVMRTIIGSPMPEEMPPLLSIVFIEVKGPRIEADALVKFRAARSNWPQYRFEMHQLSKGAWTRLLPPES